MLDIRQHRGDSSYSWSVFNGEKPVVTGLSLEQALKKKEILEKEYEHRQGVLCVSSLHTDTENPSTWKVSYNWLKRKISGN